MINNNIKIHNNYKMKVINRDGEVINEGYAENTVLDNFWNKIDNLYTNFTILSIGTGSPIDGVNVDKERVTLYSKLGNSVSLTDRVVDSELVGNVRTSKLTARAVIPANSTYVGDITEVGLSGSIHLSSLALFKDSEGVPISISKTSEDILMIDVTVYVVITYGLDITPSREIDSISKNILTGDSGAFYNGTGRLEPIDLVCLDPDSTARNNRGIISINEIGSVTVNKTLRHLDYSKSRSNYNFGNFGFANYISINNVASIKLPNEKYFPHYTISDLSVDVGDGVKTEFTYPIPEFNPNTDVVMLDGVPQVRDVDYTLAHDNNSMGYGSSFASHKTPFERVSGSADYALGYNTLDFGNGVLEYDDDITIEAVFLNKEAFISSRDKIKVEASMDGVVYEDVIDISGPILNPINVLSEPIVAKYVKVDFRSKSVPNKVSFGKKPTHLNFTTPPALGAVITTTCEVDRPFKSEDFIIDTSFKMSY